MAFELSADQQAIRELARTFAAREITPYAAAWDRVEQLDRAIVDKLGKVGFLGATLPAQYGGSGLDALSYCLIVEELGRADSSVRGLVTVSLGLCAKTIARWGTEEQCARWLPELASGRSLGCFALTEPNTGSDAGNLATAARRDGDGWRLSGEKIFITNGTWADVAVVFARTGEPGPRGITAFIVPTDREGFEATPIKGKLGLRAQDTAQVSLQDVPVSDAERLGALGGGFEVAMSTLDLGRMSLAAGCVGIARAASDCALTYAKQRTQFGRSLTRFQLVQELLADIYVETEAASLLVWHVAAMVDAGKTHTLESSVAKYYASEVAVRASNAALEVLGGYGYIDEFPVGKYLRDARVTTLYEGTSQIQKLLIARALTGDGAFV